MLQEEAAEIAKQLAKPEYAEFKASSGWLEKWKNTYGISQRSIEGDLVKSESIFENVDLFPKSAKKLKVTIRLIQSLKSSYSVLTAMHHVPII